MTSTIKTEWQKITGHRALVSFMIWIYPIGTLVSMVLIVILPVVFFDTPRQEMLNNPPSWTEMQNAVSLFVRVPENIFVRMPMMAFTAVIFAGEYQWGTWKNSIPRTSRIQLIVAKFAVISALILIAIISTSIIWVIGRGIAAGVAGAEFGPAVTGTAVFDFLKAYSLNLFVVVASTLIATAIAALIAMYSRSILVSLFVAVAYLIVEPTSLLILLIVGQTTSTPEIINIYRLTPSYNLDNFSNWASGTGGSTMSNFPGFTADFSGGLSLVMIFLWIALLLFIVMQIFQRQDISE